MSQTEAMIRRHRGGRYRQNRSRIQGAAALCLSVAGLLAVGGQPVQANGWLESRPWQFDTSADKANKAIVLDMIELKKGGYYDGFSTTVNNYNNTNIGTQINCTNGPEATGNLASNGQSANSPTVSNNSGIDSSATGNQADNGVGDSGGDVGNDQANGGNVSSGVTGSNSASDSGPINVGSSDQVLGNDQDNSGSQYANVTDSTACNMSGSTLTGDTVSTVSGPLN